MSKRIATPEITGTQVPVNLTRPAGHNTNRAARKATAPAEPVATAPVYPHLFNIPRRTFLAIGSPAHFPVEKQIATSLTLRLADSAADNALLALLSAKEDELYPGRYSDKVREAIWWNSHILANALRLRVGQPERRKRGATTGTPDPAQVLSKLQVKRDFLATQLAALDAEIAALSNPVAEPVAEPASEPAAEPAATVAA